VSGEGLKVEVWEWVGEGWTGPMLRREAAKSGSRASRSITGVGIVSWVVVRGG
jgi:hypothetical protein